MRDNQVSPGWPAYQALNRLDCTVIQVYLAFTGFTRLFIRMEKINAHFALVDFFPVLPINRTKAALHPDGVKFDWQM